MPLQQKRICPSSSPLSLIFFALKLKINSLFSPFRNMLTDYYINVYLCSIQFTEVGGEQKQAEFTVYFLCVYICENGSVNHFSLL